MKNQTQETKQEKGPPARAAYKKPALTEFGSVGMLTQAGSMGAPEGGMGGSPSMMP